MNKKIIISTIIVIGIIFTAALIWKISAQETQQENRAPTFEELLASSGLESISLEFYKSRSSRDENKQKQSEFVTSDPIQALISFTTVGSQEPEVLFNAYSEKDGTKKYLFGNDVRIKLKDSGERYITLPSNLSEGEYMAEIHVADGQLLTGIKFTVK